MNPCSHRQKDVALLAAGALDAAQIHPLRRHLAECSACRQYGEELARLCREQASALDHLPPLASAEAFHRRLVDRVRARETPPSRPLPPFVFTRWLGRKLALAGLAIGLLVIAALQYRVMDDKPNPIPVHAHRPVVSTVDAPPTFLSYQLAANKSGAALDALLARNAANSPGPDRPVTAALRALEGLTD